MSAELPQTAGSDRPRAVAMNGAFQTAIWMTLILALCTSIITLSVGVRDFEHRLHVKERGRATIGTITNIYTETGRGSHSLEAYHVDYIYRPNEQKNNNSKYIHGSDAISSSDYYSIRIGDSIPIAYDSESIERSFANFHNSAFEDDPWQRLDTTFTAAGIVLPIFLIAPAFFLPAYLRERRLLKWGLITTGTVIDEEEYYAGKAGRCSRIVYCFTDNHGRVIEGERGLLPTAEKRNSRSRKLRSRIFDHTTIFFDPRNSAKSIVYPPAWARLREPPNWLAGPTIKKERA